MRRLAIGAMCFFHFQPFRSDCFSRSALVLIPEDLNKRDPYSMETKRKAARTVRSVDKSVLEKLNAGLIETANLVEGLAMDLSVLAKKVKITSQTCPDKGIVKQMAFYGSHMEQWQAFTDHTSDTVRGFACFAIAADPKLDFKGKLRAIRALSDDSHFGVREWAWIALRPAIAGELPLALRLLSEWAVSDKPNVRRFASEATRPRGVWCAHIGELKTNPELGLPILSPLRADESKYVRDSVGNWLNDAAKSKPDWVKKVCKDWSKGRHPHTDAIVKRALRSLQ
jgi:3-methyladenine DNA glycosylase AlkC